MLADDHPLIRRAVRDVLEEVEDFKIVAEASDGEEAVKLAMELNPDVVLMDISMPGLNGLEATREILSKSPQIKVLVLTVHTETEHILGILEAGAAGYLTKKVFGPEIIHAIRALVSGESVLSEEVQRKVIRHAIKYMPKVTALGQREKLTVREKEILQCIALGMSNKDIANKLNLSQRTIKNYLAEIFSKLRVNSRTEAVICAARSGFISIDPQ